MHNNFKICPQCTKWLNLVFRKMLFLSSSVEDALPKNERYAAVGPFLLAPNSFFSSASSLRVPRPRRTQTFADEEENKNAPRDERGTFVPLLATALFFGLWSAAQAGGH